MKPFSHLLFAVAFLFTLNLNAQRVSYDRDVGFTVGIINYQGDMARRPYNNNHNNLLIGLHYRAFFREKLAFKGGAYFGKISANDRDYRWSRRAVMENQLSEVAAQIEYHFFGSAAFSESGRFHRTFSPYVGFGVGAVFSNPQITVPTVIDVSTEASSNVYVITPIELGLRMYISPQCSTTLHAAWRPTYTDLLDGLLENSDDRSTDWYILGGIGFNYTW